MEGRIRCATQIRGFDLNSELISCSSLVQIWNQTFAFPNVTAAMSVKLEVIR